MTSERIELIGVVVFGVLLGVAGWMIGLDEVRSVLVMAAAIAVGAGHSALELHSISREKRRGGTWPNRSVPLAGGARRDVQELSWRLTDRGWTVSRDAVERLRDLAGHRLARHGVDLDDPGQAAAVEHLLGPHAREVLTGRGAGAIRRRGFGRCVDAVEQLHVARRTAPTTGRSSRREQPR